MCRISFLRWPFSFFSAGDEDKAKSTRAQIHDALREMGVFYINGHGISQDEMLKLEHQMKEFFKLPSEKKRSLLYKNNKGFRGYLPMGEGLKWHLFRDEGHRKNYSDFLSFTQKYFITLRRTFCTCLKKGPY